MSPASDLDVLVIAESAARAESLAPQLLSCAGEPRALELSVVTRAAAGKPQSPWPFALHVNTRQNRVQWGTRGGDPDLLAHYAVTREAGMALIGPEPKDAIGETDSRQLLHYLCSELQWGVDHADQRYAVLNACRACAYASTGRLMSKVDGAIWWTQMRGPSEVVTRARDAQMVGADLGLSPDDARRFVLDRITELRSAL